MYIARCTDNSWTEAEITYNNAPFGSVLGTQSTTVPDNGGQAVTFSLISEASLATGGEFTLCLTMQAGCGIKIRSKQNSPATLTVNYTVPTAHPRFGDMNFMGI
ncbi:MAG: hypothetical protein HQL25_08460 [Candidatus Omnitrophica bacterium]|nr:hypothetical protein [Candidatus Omnitrophota bacterium]